MLEVISYATRREPVNITGRSLNRAAVGKLGPRGRAFLGADLVGGRLHLINPTLMQAAWLCGSNITAVWWAEQREKYRQDILDGLLPLVPPRHSPPVKIDDSELVRVMTGMGVDRVLDLLAHVEANVTA